jgi:hypothetical protein
VKITKQQLKEIIREELYSIKEELNSKQQINEGTRLGGIWKGLQTRNSGTHCLNGKSEMWSVPGTGTVFSQFLWQISPKKGYLNSDSMDSDGNIVQHNYAPWGRTFQHSVYDFYLYNKDRGIDIDRYVPLYAAKKMVKVYQNLPLKTQLKMAHGDHKLATRFLAKYGIKPSTGQ